MTQARDLADGKFDTNTLVVDAANNRVGVGTLTPADHLAVVASGANAHISVDRSDGATGRTVLIHSTSGGQLQTTGSAPLIFGTADTERGRFLSGGGLTFNGDTASANALDDYEQGSYTPSFSFTSGNGTLTTGAAVGSYTKIGNRVHINFYIKIGTKGTASGDMRFSGLPYTPASVSNRYHSGSIWMNTTVSTGALDGTYMTMLLLSPGDATIRPYVMAGSGSVTHVSAGHVQNNTDFAVSMSYDTE